MPITSPPQGPDSPGITWTNGKGAGGRFSLKRVTIEDKIRVYDINQLRDLMEELYGHTHYYTDNASTSSSKTTC